MAELLPLMERISGVMPDQSTEILTSVSLWLCILDGGFGRGDTLICRNLAPGTKTVQPKT